MRMGCHGYCLFIIYISVMVFLSGCIEERSEERELDDGFFSEIVGSTNATMYREYLNRSDLFALTTQDDICYEMICAGSGFHNLTLEDFTNEHMRSINCTMINAAVKMKITIGPIQISDPTIWWFIQDVKKEINYTYDNTTGSVIVDAVLFRDQVYDKETFNTFSIRIGKFGGCLAPIILHIDYIFLEVDWIPTLTDRI